MTKIKILILEDLLEDLELTVRVLKKQFKKAFEYKHARNKDEFQKYLNNYHPELILSDYQLPAFNGMEALELTKEIDDAIPFIIVTGSINEETAVDCLKAGAWDYVIKDNLIRLVPAINGALEKRKWIDSKQKTSEALKKSEQQLAAIFNNSPAIMMVINEQREVQKINKTGLNLSHKKTDEILGITTGKALNCKYCIDGKICGIEPECEKCRLKNFIEKNINSKINNQNTEITIESTSKDGSPYSTTYLCYFEKLWKDPENTALLTLIDITKRKETEQKLIESEQKFRELADALPEIVFEVDTMGRFQFLNKIAFEKYNLDPTQNEIHNLSISDFIHPEDLGLLSNNLSKILHGEIISGNHYKSIQPDGKTGYYQIFSSPIIKDDKITGIRGIAIDITERKRLELELNKHKEQLEELVNERTSEIEKKAKQLSESQMALSFLLDDVNESREELLASNREIKKLSQAVEQSPSSVLITNIEGNIEFVNNRFELISGYSKKEVIGNNPRFLNSGEHSKEFFKTLWKKIKTGENWYGEICNRKKNGELFWEYTSISPLRNSNNEITNFIAIKEDITERKEIESKLKEYTEELEVFNKAMVDRELKIIEMKEEVNNLYLELGKEIKYPPIWEEKEIKN